MFVSLQNWAGPKQAVPCPHNLTASGVSQGTEENREGTSRWDWGNLGKWGLCSGQNWIFQLQNDVYLQSFGLLPQSHPWAPQQTPLSGLGAQRLGKASVGKGARFWGMQGKLGHVKTMDF